MERVGLVASARRDCRRSPVHRLFNGSILLLMIWLSAAYLMIPMAWRWRRHPALEDAPRITHTANGIPGDPLNVALVGTEEQVQMAMLAAKWFPADPITFRSSLRIATGTALHRSYENAPVSNLFLWGRKQDLAFEQPVGNDPRRRHHVRFWRSEKVDDDGTPLWFGAATFDTKVGFSHTTGQITHHISPDLDAERNKLIDDLSRTDNLLDVYWVDGFQEKLTGENGGGDPYHTDGRLAVGVVTITNPPVQNSDTKETEDQDERFRRMVVGTWEDEYQGKRTMTLKDDGTGTMVVELSGLKATLFATRLQFNMQWAVEGGHLKKQTTGGEPAQQVQLILKTMGDRVDEPILELTDDRLRLLDQDGKTKYDWRRVRTEKRTE